jgi:hypothetical protein
MTFAFVALAVLQAPAADQGTLIVRQDTVEIARERFQLTPGRSGAPGPGWTLESSIRYDRSRPVVVLAPILQIGADSAPVALQYEVADPREPVRILGEVGRGRFTVRFLARAAERAREFACDRRTAVLDDSVFALYLLAAWQARSEPGAVTAVMPRGLRSDALTVRAHGPAATLLNRDSATLNHVTLTGGPNDVVNVWLDASGRLMKIDIPSRRLTAERVPGG